MSERVRVDLAAHRRTRPVAGAHAELVEQTPVGDVLVRELMRVQLGLALRLAGVVAVTLGGLPLVFTLWPAVTRVSVAGIGLPWLLLGVAAFPFLAVAGWVYTRLAERNEADFAALVGRPPESPQRRP
ncbi:hypothetical protein Cs7R123_57660 [Catellatospora sp. TT07R-123]|uniref:hypothetical protein n=1 Tax=Catellatospora sp. TT07R-123 TaxID=2733863 RepID=UPI001B225C7F|nr:hypothetical protein [Catellatospora sp. TT07R-123]GHJ48424.1 hypothetical protein Cs7R123_57660 [Catellatospora sp. TT07R-123]